MSNTRLYWLHALSPTHVGIGRGMGYIDLPIDRDGVTNWPIVRGSGFKGVLADFHKATEKKRDEEAVLRLAFGKAGDSDSNSGSLMPTDARLVCLPVRSFRGTFAWTTSVMCLSMLARTLKLAGVTRLLELPPRLEKGAMTTDSSALLQDKKVYLEDLDFSAMPDEKVTAWAAKIASWVFPDDKVWQETFKQRFVVIPDTAFDFLCETGTEVHTRVKIDDNSKTVVDGALWTEESIPAETILMGIIHCDKIFHREKDAKHGLTPEKLLEQFASGTPMLQIGGKATVGRGQVRCIFSEVK
ncbi:type III-B CRISPR module RAMP protein Cmr4 [Tuwongella immobilis]|uniref:CRISPR type III-associated protein domain-containing protein n=1 Tax=Tuwongella immobilis TaxID=692036 RepID=A0A6C2YLY4_9BACT|nr:type III-B CRISPR module RAMP protein Cmr4 [Tuwongella immobilis]VIP02239.1 CRISPR-associated RAMP protein, Cmr4 family OS=Pyramidobacter piscolens W5455 GN=cmr4 PE=4 SV=1: RAMPs [Tuwongella immobilis]VTS00804.1 CRISPR-associated RAMP protein, Cmr4 family OS=Pyramidobacter piscolens W5455 GN=cmr4 PE=4 SV=1: RAMPs [Tuwongella immobilis]